MSGLIRRIPDGIESFCRTRPLGSAVGAAVRRALDDEAPGAVEEEAGPPFSQSARLFLGTHLAS